MPNITDLISCSHALGSVPNSALISWNIQLWYPRRTSLNREWMPQKQTAHVDWQNDCVSSHCKKSNAVIYDHWRWGRNQCLKKCQKAATVGISRKWDEPRQSPDTCASYPFHHKLADRDSDLCQAEMCSVKKLLATIPVGHKRKTARVKARSQMFPTHSGRQESPDGTVGCEDPKGKSGHRGACKARFGNPLIGCHAGN